VYEHFADLPNLVAGLVLDRFAAVDATIAGALAQTEGPGLDAALFATKPGCRCRPLTRSLRGDDPGRPQRAGS
jgi:hypothetical protein